MSLTIVNAEVGGEIRDVTISGGHTLYLDGSYLDPADDDVVDAQGGALLPGLHHPHLHLMALATGPVECGSARGPDEMRHLLTRSTTPWIRAVNYHESTAGELTRHQIDRWVSDRPVRIRHRHGKLWMFNSLGLSAIAEVIAPPDGTKPDGVEYDDHGVPNGRLWHFDDRLRAVLPALEPDFAALGDSLLRLGITAVTDPTPSLSATTSALLTAAHSSGALPQELVLLGARQHSPDDLAVDPRPSDHDVPQLDCPPETDPWRVLAQAQPSAGSALQAFLGSTNRYAARPAGETTHFDVGQRRNVCLLSAPLHVALADPDPGLVRGALCGGIVSDLGPPSWPSSLNGTRVANPTQNRLI